MGRNKIVMSQPTVKTNSDSQEQALFEQFNHPEKFELNGMIIKVVDIQPQKLKTNIPTIVVPGFSATPDTLKDLILQTALAGRRVISAYAPHGISLKTKNKDVNLPEAEMRKLELLLQLISVKNFSRVNVIANSEGAIAVTTAATLYPDKFANIILIDPAGLIGDDNFFQLAKRKMADAEAEELFLPKFKKVRYPASKIDAIESFLINIPASLKEIHAIAHSDITENLKKIHEAGIGLKIIHGIDDKIFPLEKVRAMIDEKTLCCLQEVEGSHNMIYSFEPYGRQAEQALTDLEQKK
jgi:pimeloyl-ACP methyl ester carboxylesterase